MHKEETKFVRVNEHIRFTPIRLISSDGQNSGIISTREALSRARAQELDLVEIAPHARPPVCRIMDYSKYKYEQQMKEKEHRHKQKVVQTKEVRFRPNTGEHDVLTKVNAIRKFLTEGHKVQIKITFKQRENVHRDLGFRLIQDIIASVKDQCRLTNSPQALGRDIVCLLEPCENSQ